MRRSPRALFWGMVLISTLLHIVASVAPWFQSPTSNAGPQPSEDQSELVTTPSAIPLIQLPPQKKSDPQRAIASPELALQNSQPSLLEPVITAPIVEAKLVEAKLVEAKQATDLSAPLPVEPLAIDEPPEALPDQEPAADLDLEASDLEASGLEISDLETSDSETSDLEEPLLSPEPALELEPEQGAVLQLAADFPHLAGAQSGCYGLDNCHRSSGHYRQVVQQLTAQMRANGYRLTENNTIDGVGHRVFEVVVPDDPTQLYYLNVFSDGLDSAVYAITVNILSLTELKSLQV